MQLQKNNEMDPKGNRLETNMTADDHDDGVDDKVDDNVHDNNDILWWLQ